ncbi:N-acetylglucosaminyldiphosphodolichol N-acetylglucosaminyltransferase [Giardia muris]|uniref:UDP-N-acetylglucosamine transferase subunit ALG13 n=1 Tax=Giardia muris TaxID=5742 RepID=A0A4Z1SZY6_GIAMU|nr:N-acetylglucosaminyldiphosphodolichol N-acetylglucosaminyltransferase [Giardia muris]|eukprot:TNJ26217.1 N-acetylglucosaminyldiphosphodolichol N-acetylglucosaminyltransferase [Giardia muris]
MHALITVGTTRFDSLITLFEDRNFLQALAQAGITALTIQHGGSPFTPPNPPLPCQLTSFAFSQDFLTHLKATDLVISHASGGIYVEAQSFKKPQILVVNTTLHENHQAEFASLLRSNVTGCRAYLCADDFRAAVMDPSFSQFLNELLCERKELQGNFDNLGREISYLSSSSFFYGPLFIALSLLVFAILRIWHDHEKE